VTTPKFNEQEFTSVEQFEQLLRDSEWLVLQLVLPAETKDDLPTETDFVLLVCPYCGATVPPVSRGYDFRNQHVLAHVADLTRAVLAGAGGGIGVSLGE
jgi:hypothetical protein